MWRFGDISRIRTVAQQMNRSEGAVIHQICTLMEQTPDQLGALGAAYNWLVAHQGLTRVRKFRQFEDIGDAVAIFRAGRGQHHLGLAVSIVSDAQVALVEFVEAWNEGRMDAARAAMDTD